MPKRAQKYFGVSDLLQAWAEVERSNAEKKDRIRAAEFSVRVEKYIDVYEKRIDYERAHKIDTSALCYHRLEMLRAYRAQIGRILCHEPDPLPPVPPVSQVGNTGGNGSGKAGSRSSSSSRTRSASSSVSAGLTK